jgi:signal recognition particle receptor subunit beta
MASATRINHHSMLGCTWYPIIIIHITGMAVITINGKQSLNPNRRVELLGNNVTDSIMTQRIIFVGDGAVGKTSFIRSILGDHVKQGENEYDATFGLTYHEEHAGLRCYEVGGQTEVTSKLQTMVASIADVVVAMYDLSRPRTLYTAARWVTWFHQEHPTIPVLLVANKRGLLRRPFSVYDYPSLQALMTLTRVNVFFSDRHDTGRQLAIHRWLRLALPAL